MFIFSDVEGVLKSANGTEYGLASGVFTKDLSKVCCCMISNNESFGRTLQMTFLKTKKGSSFAMESVKGQLSLLNIPSFTAEAILKLLELYDFIVLGKKRKIGMMKKLEPV